MTISFLFPIIRRVLEATLWRSAQNIVIWDTLVYRLLTPSPTDHDARWEPRCYDVGDLPQLLELT